MLPHQCQACDQRFKTKAGLRQHKSRKHNQAQLLDANMANRRFVCRHCYAACPCREALQQHEQECAQEIQDQSVTSEDSSRLALLKLPKKCDPNSVLGRLISSMNERRRRKFALKKTPIMLKA